MRFYVYSRQAIDALGVPDVPHVVISITSYPDDVARLRSSPYRRGVLRLSFSDVVVASERSILFDATHARAICAFITEHRAAIDEVLVHCDAGFSRSPAVAAAIAKCLGEDDAEFFRRYQPNMHVYQTLLDTWSGRDDLEHVLHAALLRDDCTSLRDLCWECAEREPPVVSEHARELILHVLRRALREGSIVAGDFEDGTFIPWSGHVDETIARIAVAWRALGRDPEPGELVIFRRSR